MNKQDERVLRKKTRDFDLRGDRKAISRLIQEMRQAMRKANGVGLSANQIGLDAKVFVAQVPDTRGSLKFYAFFNPKIEKTGGEKLLLEEGCLSVPGKYGSVERFERITVSGYDKNGKSLKIKAWGLLAHVFQHEIDHLNGILFIDKAKELHEVSPIDQAAAKQRRSE